MTEQKPDYMQIARECGAVSADKHNISMDGLSVSVIMDADDLARFAEHVRGVPEGYKLVPIEPTDEMIAAACVAADMFRVDAMRALEAAIANAPSAPGLAQGCCRSHPHEDMNAECERKTAEARSANEAAQDAPAAWLASYWNWNKNVRVYHAARSEQHARDLVAGLQRVEVVPLYTRPAADALTAEYERGRRDLAAYVQAHCGALECLEGGLS